MQPNPHAHPRFNQIQSFLLSCESNKLGYQRSVLHTLISPFAIAGVSLQINLGRSLYIRDQIIPTSLRASFFALELTDELEWKESDSF